MVSKWTLRLKFEQCNCLIFVISLPVAAKLPIQSIPRHKNGLENNEKFVAENLYYSLIIISFAM